MERAVAAWTEVLRFDASEPRALEYLGWVSATRRSASPPLRIAVEKLLADRRYEDALELLHVSRSDEPDAADIPRAIQVLKQRLTRRYLRQIGDLDNVPRRSTAPPDELPEDEATLLRLVDGVSSYGDIVTESRLGRFETYRLFARWLSAGVIVAQGPWTVDQARVETGENDTVDGDPHPEAKASLALVPAGSQGVVPAEIDGRQRRSRGMWAAALLVSAAGAFAVWAGSRAAAPAHDETMEGRRGAPSAVAVQTVERPRPPDPPGPPPPPERRPEGIAERDVEVLSEPTTIADDGKDLPIRRETRTRGPRAASSSPPPAKSHSPAPPPPATPPPTTTPAPEPRQVAERTPQTPPPHEEPTMVVPSPESLPPQAAPAPSAAPTVGDAALAALDVRGSLTRGSVERAARRLLPAFSECFRQANPSALPTAAIELRLTIDETGRAQGIAVAGAPSAALAACVRDVTATLRTGEPPDVGVVEVQARLVYQPRRP